jgi:hypothetical protein
VYFLVSPHPKALFVLKTIHTVFCRGQVWSRGEKKYGNSEYALILAPRDMDTPISSRKAYRKPDKPSSGS